LISIIEGCQPREGVLEGTFNPEVFTGSLLQVMSHYRGRGGRIDNIYTDADRFFRDGTTPTDASCVSRQRNRRRRGIADRPSAAALPRRMQRRRRRAGGASAARAGDLYRADKQNFAQKVAAVLNEASTRDEFDCLILVAPAHALGELRQALDAPTQRKIMTQPQKTSPKYLTPISRSTLPI
jgi:hypothetical protein